MAEGVAGIKPGLWLVVLEVTVVNYGWMFDLDLTHPFLQVIWAIGVSMVCLSALMLLPRGVVLSISLLMIGGHHMLDGLQPAGWASRAMALVRRLEADAIVAEVNMGGDMVSAVLRQIDATVPVKTVHATRGKWLRAEPVAAMYAQGKVKHVGAAFAELEDEMCDFGLGGLSGGRSPDRLDALVWYPSGVGRLA